MRRRIGYTLVEVMVALVLSSLVIGMAFALLQGSRGNFSRVRGSIELQSEIREAVRMIEHDLRNTGFKISNNYSSRILATVRCPLAYADLATGDSSSFLHVNRSDWTNPGDEITFAQYVPDGAGNVSCSPANLRVIRYRLLTSDSLLVRSEATLFSGIASAAEIPVCRSVVAFQMEYGLLGVDSTLWDTSTTLNSAWLGTARVSTTTTLSGWSNATVLYAFSTTTNDIQQGSVYRFAVTLTPNDSMATPPTGTNRILVGFLDGTQLVDTVSAWVGTTSGRSVILDVEASRNITAAHIAIGGRLVSPSAVAKIAISGLRVSQHTLTHYRWLSDPTPAQKRRIRAFRLSLITKTEREVKGTSPWTFEGVGDLPGLGIQGPESRKGYAFFQRIVPVVNHGL